MASTSVISMAPGTTSNRSSNNSNSSFMSRRRSSQQSIPIPLDTTLTAPRSRTTSLFTSVTSPLLSRMSFGNNNASSSNSNQNRNNERRGSEPKIDLSSSLLSRNRSSSFLVKGKGKELSLSTNESSRPPKSKSAQIAKRLSTPATSPPLPSTTSDDSLASKPQMESRWSEDSALGGYSRKAETFSKSSPDLSELGKYQPWPSMNSKDGEYVENVDNLKNRRRSRVLSGSNITRYAHKAAKSFSSILLPTSPKISTSSFSSSSNTRIPQLPALRSTVSPIPHSPALSTDEFLSQSINSNSSSSTPPVSKASTLAPLQSFPQAPYTKASSSSPPSPTSASRLAARAEALAKLTEPPPLISSRRKISPAPDEVQQRRSAIIDTFPSPRSSNDNKRKSNLSSGELTNITNNNLNGNSRWSEDTSLSGGGITPTTPSRLSTSSILSSYQPVNTRSSQNSSRDSIPLPLPPSRPKKSSSRTKSQQQRVAVLESLEKEIVRDEVKKARSFLESAFGASIFESKRIGMEKYEFEDEIDEVNLWSVLRNGVLLCRLLNQLELYSPPILSSQIDRRGDSAATISNIDLFLDAATTFYNISPDELFIPSDLQSNKRTGLRKVLNTLSLIQTSKTRSNNSTPLPIDINLRGRVMRAKSMNTGAKSSSSADSHGFDSLRDNTPPRHNTGSPDSSNYQTDSPYNSSGPSRKSHESSTRPSITFSDTRTKENDIQLVKKNSIYSGTDRRMTTSAIELTILEEDEISSLKSKIRNSLTIDTKAVPQVKRNNSKRYQQQSDIPTSSMRLDSPDGLPKPRVRSRNSSEISKPNRLALKRSMSNITTAAEAFERQELVPIEARKSFIARRISSNNSSTTSIPKLNPPSIQIPSSLSQVPFPSTPSPSTTTPPRTPRTPTKTPIFIKPESPIRPTNQHKRWNSELYVENSARDEGINLRSRHESLANVSTRKEVGENGNKIARTKLVLREDGKPTLTYQLGECIGKGQFGSVYRALNLGSGRVSAIKRIGLEGRTESEVDQLSNEVHLLRSLVHPAIVQYEGLVRTEHYLNIILEYVENGSLQKTIEAFGELPEELVASYVVKILEGLSYLHRQNVVHCDLKAANILSTKTGNIKLADFGVSLNLNAVQTIAKDAYEANGTPYWMAPEVIQLQGASTSADIWSLACTIIELVTGKPPYSEMLPMSAMFRIVEDDRPPIPAKCSPELVEFLSLCFAKDPRARPTADALFHHVWLQKNWDPQKDLRPQDSIPFLRRISTEVRRPEFDVYSSPLSERFSASPAELSLLSTSVPNNSRSPFQYLDAFSQGSNENINGGYRSSFDSPRLGPSLMNDPSDFQLSPSAPQRLHTFVKTTFSQAVECKICHEFTKKHSVLCSGCAIICHSRCEQFAPINCDLRSQLLNYSSSADRTQSPLSNSPASPTSPVNGSSTNYLSNLAVILPFSKRKPRITPSPPLPPLPAKSNSNSPSPSPQDLSSLPPLPSTPPLRPSLPPNNNSRTRLSDLINRRSPASTPPTSIRLNSTNSTGKDSTSTHSSLNRVQVDLDRENSFTSSPENSPIESRRGVISFSENGIGGGVTNQTNSTGTNKLARRKSHGRSQSSGAIKKPSESDCLMM